MPTDEVTGRGVALPPLWSTIAAARARVGAWRQAGLRVGLVPTMGNLHAGHLSLVDCVRPHCDRVVVSVFVNPLQFGDGEDFDSYPRTLDADRALLAEVGVQAVFSPTVAEMYPDGGASKTIVSVPGLEAMLCGAHRRGHFAGVATVVTKLLSIVQPDVAVFGRKDFQQLMIIRQLVRDLCLPVTVLEAPTLRAADGLALSSRNQYLAPAERAVAPILHAQLAQVAAAVANGEAVDAACERASRALVAAGFRPDYVEVRAAADLGVVSADTRDIVVLGAAWLGQARLIDNVQVTAAPR